MVPRISTSYATSIVSPSYAWQPIALLRLTCRLTKNQWKKLIERNLADVVNREITNKCAVKKKVQHLMQENGNLKKYFTQYTWEAARTLFEVRTNMVKLDCNFGHRESICCICGDKESEHVSGAERKVLPLRGKPDFSDLRSPLRSRSAAPRSRSAPPYFSETRSPLRSAPPEFWSAPFPLRSHPVINSVANSCQLKLGLRVACFVAYYGDCTCIALLFSIS